jgi:hypothetical protein
MQSVCPIGALHDLGCKKKHAVEKQIETLYLSNEEEVK